MTIFLYDVIIMIVLGYLFGWVYSKKLYEENEFYIPVLCLFTLIFWLNVIFSNTGLIEPWFIGGIYTAEVTTLIGVFYVLSYPLWFTWATRIFQAFWGSAPWQNGIFWALGHKERAKPFKPAWYTSSSSYSSSDE